jgi:branched-chain amino acid transport system ATP-binding protein
LLSIKNLNKSFGGLRAVNAVNFEVKEKSIVALIGPNGAGKSTVLNLISGNLVPDSGEIWFRGENLSGKSIQEIAGKGIGRAFQTPALFLQLTTLENVAATLLTHQKRAYDCLGKIPPRIEEEALRLLDYFGIQSYARETAKNLSHGDQRRLELALCLAMEPSLLLLDEPTQGMSIYETRQFVKDIKELNQKRGVTTLLVEHDMSVVFSISDQVVVLNRGMLLASGTPQEVRANAAVREAYLGNEG